MTTNRLIELGALPIINENDTVATDEISVGDNDTLAAIVAVNLDAELLVLLTDINGLYTSDPRNDADAKLIPVVENIDDQLKLAAGGKGTKLGTGGMATKLNAADICMDKGTDVVIANGDDPEVLYDIIDGKQIGTRFIGKK